MYTIHNHFLHFFNTMPVYWFVLCVGVAVACSDWKLSAGIMFAFLLHAENF